MLLQQEQSTEDNYSNVQIKDYIGNRVYNW
mgnify:CR=1 FL=1